MAAPLPPNRNAPSYVARGICPNWHRPEGDAHFRDVVRALEKQRELGKVEGLAEREKEIEELRVELAHYKRRVEGLTASEERSW